MMNIDEFILKDNPRKEEVDDVQKEVIFLLDELYIDPMERELLKFKLEMEVLSKRDIPYRADLVKAYVEYHMENKHLPILVEALGLDNIIVDKILNGFKKIMPEFSFINYESGLCGAFPKGLIGVSNEYLAEHKEFKGVEVGHVPQSIHDFKKIYFHEMGTAKEQKKASARKNASLILEYLGHMKQDEKMIVTCMIFDRRHTIHGYVALKV